MRKISVVLASLIVCTLAAAQPQTEPASHTWTTEPALTSSVREAWALGGKTPEGFFEIVKALSEISARKRNITLAEAPEAGAKAGEWIKSRQRKTRISFYMSWWTKLLDTALE